MTRSCYAWYTSYCITCFYHVGNNLRNHNLATNSATQDPYFLYISITTIIFGVNINFWRIWSTWLLKSLLISLLIIFKTIYFLYCKLPKSFQGHYYDYNTISTRRKRKMIFLFLKGVNSLFYGAIRKCNVLCRNLKCHGLIWSKNILSVSTS